MNERGKKGPVLVHYLVPMCACACCVNLCHLCKLKVKLMKQVWRIWFTALVHHYVVRVITICTICGSWVYTVVYGLCHYLCVCSHSDSSMSQQECYCSPEAEQVGAKKQAQGHGAVWWCSKMEVSSYSTLSSADAYAGFQLSLSLQTHTAFICAVGVSSAAGWCQYSTMWYLDVWIPQEIDFHVMSHHVISFFFFLLYAASKLQSHCC